MFMVERMMRTCFYCGKNDENLFLLDGTPLYQVNHVGGLFSAFHTDMVKNVDFYKSGFPARYGGRLSSVVDVRTKEGDMKSYHGVFSLGLLDGRIQWEGPIVKDKTSFCFGMRRSWADLFKGVNFRLPCIPDVTCSRAGYARYLMKELRYVRNGTVPISICNGET